MKSTRRAVTVFVVMGMAVVLALLEYGSVGAVYGAARSPAIAAKTETKAQKLKKCKKQKSKSKRKACEKKVRAGRSQVTTMTTGTGTAITTGTGTAMTTGTVATTTGTGITGMTTTGGPGTTTGATTGTTTGTKEQKELKELKELEMSQSAKQNLLDASNIAAGASVFEISCAVCHGKNGGGESGDNYVAYTSLPRAQTVAGVIDQLIEPDLGMPNVGEEMKFAKRKMSRTTSA